MPTQLYLESLGLGHRIRCLETRLVDIDRESKGEWCREFTATTSYYFLTLYITSCYFMLLPITFLLLPVTSCCS